MVIKAVTALTSLRLLGRHAEILGSNDAGAVRPFRNRQAKNFKQVESIRSLQVTYLRANSRGHTPNF